MTTLSVKRPTSTTVLYTVSTRSPTTTLTARASDYLTVLARIFAGIFVATILLHEYHTVFPPPLDDDGKRWMSSLASLTNPLENLAVLLSTHSTRLWRLIISSGIAWLIFRKSYTEESLLVIRGLGVQTSTSSPSYLWASSTRFIPTSSIQDIFIYEAFKGFEVRFYLSIVVEGEEDVVVVFPNILPQREILEDVWRGARACLYEPKS